MAEIVNYEMSIIDTGCGISFNCNGKEIGVLDYETVMDRILTPQWVIDEINSVIDAHLIQQNKELFTDDEQIC